MDESRRKFFSRDCLDGMGRSEGGIEVRGGKGK